MVVVAAARMTPVSPNPAAVNPFEVARAEVVEALARMVNCVTLHQAFARFRSVPDQ